MRQKSATQYNDTLVWLIEFSTRKTKLIPDEDDDDVAFRVLFRDFLLFSLEGSKWI